MDIHNPIYLVNIINKIRLVSASLLILSIVAIVVILIAWAVAADCGDEIKNHVIALIIFLLVILISIICLVVLPSEEIMETMIAENNYEDLFMIPQFIKQMVISFIKVVALLSIVGYTAMISYNHFWRKEND